MKEKEASRNFCKKNLGKKFIHPQYGVVTICGYDRRSSDTVIISPSSPELGWRYLVESNVIQRESETGYLYVGIDTLTAIPVLSLPDKLKNFFKRKSNERD